MNNPFSEQRKSLIQQLSKLDIMEDNYATLVEEWTEAYPDFAPDVSVWGIGFNAVVETKKEIATVVSWFLKRGFKISSVSRPSQYSTAWYYYLRRRDSEDSEDGIELRVSPKQCRRVETGQYQSVPIYTVVCD